MNVFNELNYIFNNKILITKNVQKHEYCMYVGTWMCIYSYIIYVHYKIHYTQALQMTS